MIFSLSAAFSVYQIAANTGFAVPVPGERRAQSMGIPNVGVVVGQRVAFLRPGPPRRGYPGGGYRSQALSARS
jgi:hypothetical protein